MSENKPELRRESLKSGISLNVTNFRTTPVKLKVPHLNISKWIAPEGTQFVPETLPSQYRSLRIVDKENSVDVLELIEAKRKVSLWPRQLLWSEVGCKLCMEKALDIFKPIRQSQIPDRSEEFWAVQQKIDELEPCPDCSKEENQLEIILSVTNSREKAIEIIHEPLGDVFVMNPGDTFDIAGHRPDPSLEEPLDHSPNPFKI